MTSELITFLQKEVLHNNVFLDNDYKYLKNIFETIIINHLSSNYWNTLTKTEQHNLIKHLTNSSCALSILIMNSIVVYKVVDYFQISFSNKFIDIKDILYKTTFIKYGSNSINYDNDIFLLNGEIKYFIGYGLFDYVILSFIFNDYEYFSLISINELLNHSTIIKHDLIVCNSLNMISFKLKDLKISKDKVICKYDLNKPLLFHTSLINSSSMIIGQINKVLHLINENNSKLTQPNITDCYLTLLKKLQQLEQDYLLNTDYNRVLAITNELNILGANCILFVEQIWRSLLIFKTNNIYQIKKEMTLLRVINIDLFGSMVSKNLTSDIEKNLIKYLLEN